jgi:hypothetical protein
MGKRKPTNGEKDAMLGKKREAVKGTSIISSFAS